MKDINNVLANKDPRKQRREAKSAILTREELYAGVDIFKLVLPLFTTDDSPKVGITNRGGSIRFEMPFTGAMVDSIFGEQGPNRVYTVFAKAVAVRSGPKNRDVTLKLRAIVPKQDW